MALRGRRLIWRKKDWERFKNNSLWHVPYQDHEKLLWVEPLGYGFCWVRDIREGFWRHKKTNKVFAGYFCGHNHFHVIKASMQNGTHTVSMEESPEMDSVPFEEGVKTFVIQLHEEFKEIHGITIA